MEASISKIAKAMDAPKALFLEKYAAILVGVAIGISRLTVLLENAI